MANTDQTDHLATLLETLDDLLVSADENIKRAQLIKRRVANLRRQVAKGVPLAEVVAATPNPVIVELITENIEALQSVGSRVRWAQASALRSEGLSITAIANLFGVTRQRVSALLKNPPAAVKSRR